jgi:hypothetical protein
MCAARAIPESIMLSDEARDAILRELLDAPLRPTELLARLGDRFSDFEIKETLLRLLHEGALVLTSDRQLKIPAGVL